MDDSPAYIADTIAALATPPGRGAIAVIRISGPGCRDILRRVFQSADKFFNAFKPRFMHHGHIQDPQGRILDEVLAVLMPGPATFTGEDAAEIHAHGGGAVARAVLDAVFAAGARQAQRGEFTRRAFLNGRIDLSQAEAVAECIEAASWESLRLAQDKLGGLLAAQISGLRDRLLNLSAQMAVAVDFPEEDAAAPPKDATRAEILSLQESCLALAAGYDRARIVRQGALVVLAGQTNVGKSSLMNALLGRERAIVTPHPGTTRDFLEEMLDLDGLPVRLVDTAGLRAARDPVEQEGLRRARELISQADLVLWVTDVTHKPDEAELRAEAEEMAQLAPGKVLGVMNKIDLLPAVQEFVVPLAIPTDSFQAGRSPSADSGWVQVSARMGTGLAELAGQIRQRLSGSETAATADPLPAPNQRQYHVLQRAAAELAELGLDLENSLPADLLGVRLELVCAILGEITGEIATDEILDQIFAEFCLGK